MWIFEIVISISVYIYMIWDVDFWKLYELFVLDALFGEVIEEGKVLYVDFFFFFHKWGIGFYLRLWCFGIWVFVRSVVQYLLLVVTFKI